MKKILIITIFLFTLAISFSSIVHAQTGSIDIICRQLTVNPPAPEEGEEVFVSLDCSSIPSHLQIINLGTGGVVQQFNSPPTFTTFSVGILQPGNYDFRVFASDDATLIQHTITIGSSGNEIIENDDSLVQKKQNGEDCINTAIGCIPIEPKEAAGFFLRWGIGIAGGIAFLLIVYGGFQIMTSAGDPKKTMAGKELITAAVSGLLLLIFSVFIIRLIGIDILGIL